MKFDKASILYVLGLFMVGLSFEVERRRRRDAERIADDWRDTAFTTQDALLELEQRTAPEYSKKVRADDAAAAAELEAVIPQIKANEASAGVEGGVPPLVVAP